MPAIAQIPPNVLVDLLLTDGWKVTSEDTYNWLLEKRGKDPLPIPKRAKLIPFQIHEHVLLVAGIEFGDYFELLKKVGYRT